MSCSEYGRAAHEPLQDHEYRIVYYLAAANIPRWTTAGYFNKLDQALERFEKRRESDPTTRLEVCTWSVVEHDPTRVTPPERSGE